MHLEFIYSWCHENGFFNVNSVNEHYLHYLSSPPPVHREPFSGNTGWYTVFLLSQDGVERFEAM